MARKPKQVVTVQIPNAITEFMVQVQKLILAGDKSTTIDSDDLLQCSKVYGGLYNTPQRLFGFRYFYSDDETWDFQLAATQIAAIAEGDLSELVLWQCAGGRCNCFYATEDSYCKHCDSVRYFDDYEFRLRSKHPDKDDKYIMARVGLRKIGSAIADYRNKHGHFPSFQTQSPDGTLLHSWRSLILPFLDEEDVYSQIDFSQPWDSNLNRKIWDQRPKVYAGSVHPVPLTSCMAITGQDTIWPVEGPRRLSDIKSGYSNTVAAITTNHSTVNWMQPCDLNVDAALSEYKSNSSLLAVFVDGHVKLIEDVNTSELRELFCI